MNAGAVGGCAADRTAVYRKIVLDIDAVAFALGGQDAVACEGQIALDFNAAVEGSAVAADGILANQLNGQRAVGVNAAAIVSGGDLRVIQRQGVGCGIVNRGAIAAAHRVIRGGKHTHAVHIRRFDFRAFGDRAVLHLELCRVLVKLVGGIAHIERAGIRKLDGPALGLRRGRDMGGFVDADIAGV